MPSGAAAASIAASGGASGAASDSTESSSRAGSHVRSTFIARSAVAAPSHEQSGAEVEPRGEDRPGAIVPTLMYSRPVADSIDRAAPSGARPTRRRAGTSSPTISRSQTNSAQGRLRAANGPPAAGPVPDPTHTRTARPGGRRLQNRRARPGRAAPRAAPGHEVPVAEDHRREDAAGGRREDHELEQERRPAASRPRSAPRSPGAAPRPPSRRRPPGRAAPAYAGRTSYGDDQDEHGQRDAPRDVEGGIRDDRRVDGTIRERRRRGTRARRTEPRRRR